MSIFQRAERRQGKLKVAITGPSGSGKTFSSLLLAAGIGKRIAVVDTENHSASLYADYTTGLLAGIEFDILAIDPPYTVQKYLTALEAAEREGYDVLIVDSISHAWAGEGGLLDKKSALDQRPNANTWSSWGKITPEHEKFRAMILQSKLHIICTMRSKQDYILSEVNGKKVPQKVGMAPIQRDGMEYEFTVVFDLAMDHNATASKDRTSLFDGEVFKPSRETAKRLMDWLSSAKPALPQAPEPELEPEGGNGAAAVPEQLAEIAKLSSLIVAAGEKAGDVMYRIRKYVEVHHKKAIVELDDLTADEADAVIKALTRYLAKKESAKEARP